MMQVGVCRTLAELRSIAGEWRLLCERGGRSGIFSLPEWHIAWWETIGRSYRMEVVTVMDGDKLVGVLPLLIRRASWHEGWVRALEFSGGTQSDQHDAILAPEHEPEVRRALDRKLDELVRAVDVVRLLNIPASSPSIDWLKQRYHPYLRTTPHPVLRLDIGLVAIEKEWRSSHRVDVRRQRRRLESQGNLTLEVLQDGSAAHRTLDEFFSVYRRKWEIDGDTRALADPLWKGPLQSFYHALWDNLGPALGVHFSVLTLNGRPISYHFGFLYEGRLYWYRPTFDQEFQSFSPSKVHVLMLIEAGCTAGWTEFDFLLGAEPYKYAWTRSQKYVQSAIFAGGATFGAVAAWWMGKGRDLARKHVASRLRR